ncbi:MAG TPA: hypothetical protein PKE12_11160 [Kiritimatiellia bacterium]|nr:hypothetical protein [Kiritimatiellia bacterium]
MNSRTPAVLPLVFALAFSAGAAPVPVAPLAPIELHGHENVFLLQNRLVEAAIFPTLGRLCTLNFRGEENVLRFDRGLAEASVHPPVEPPGDWRNFGGDWLWPSAQEHWEKYFGKRWPAPTLLDVPPWTAHGWINDDQSQSVAMEIDLGAPLHITVQRTFTLPPDSTAITVHQRMTRTGESAMPVTLWNISQVGGASRVALATETNTLFVGGYRVLDFDPPAPTLLNQEDPHVLIIDVGAAEEVKLGSDSPRGWIAAQRGDYVLLERATGSPGATNFPDGGCRTELYSNRGLGYSEIETLSEERVLEVGETIENILTISLHRMPASIDNAAFAARLRELAGDPPAPLAVQTD